jgi:predicted transcriptional regulator
MTPIRKAMTFRVDDDLVDGMQALFARDGISPSEQLRRALRAFLESKGVSLKTATAARGKRARKT